MILRPPARLIGALLVAFVVMLTPLGERSLMAAPLVRDDAGMFDAATVQKVNDIVKMIHDEFGKDLTIKTFAAIPEKYRPGLKAESKDVFYDHWVWREARAAETNGVFVLIVKNPGRIQIGVGTQTSPKAFTVADRDEMRDLMVTKFEGGKSGEGMIAGAQFVLERMEKNGTKHVAPPARAEPPATPAVHPTPSTSAALPATVSAPATQPTTQPASAPAATKSAPAGLDVKPAAAPGVELNK